VFDRVEVGAVRWLVDCLDPVVFEQLVRNIIFINKSVILDENVPGFVLRE
jgi:hypothetical protein